MARNVEIKARVREPERVRQAALALADGPIRHLEQEDTFYHVPRGRLKLRVLSPGCGELIAYERPDTGAPAQSTYFIHRTEDPEGLHRTLEPALGVRGVVRKTRDLLLTGRTRIHLDEVVGLGNFLELEVVLEEGQSEAEGAAEARDLLRALGVPAEDMIACAYIDLLEESKEAG